jgi:hypothetical protein
MSLQLTPKIEVRGTRRSGIEKISCKASSAKLAFKQALSGLDEF